MPDVTTSSHPRDIVFYDGNCGLCHRWVQRCLEADPRGEHFDFAPRGGQTWQDLLTEAQRADAPESIVVLTRDGQLMFKRRAVAYIGDKLKHHGGIRLTTWPMRHLPDMVGDTMYAAVARVRHHVMPKPSGACPVTPPELRGRFLA